MLAGGKLSSEAGVVAVVREDDVEGSAVELG